MEKPAGSIFIFNFAAADFAMANELELMAAYIISEMVILVSWKKIPENRREVWTGHPLTMHICAVQFVHKRAPHKPRAWLKQSRIAFHLCAPEKNLSSSVAHLSPFVVVSPAVYYHEHIIFLIHSSFYHDTRTRRTPSTSRTSPSSPSRQAAPSRITLA